MRFVSLLIVILFILTTAFAVFVHFSDDSDYNAPQISCSTDTITVSVKDNEKEILKHVKASDEKDGDITDSVIIESVSPFVEKKCAKVTFAVADSDNNVAKLTKDIVYSDYVNPEFAFEKQHVYFTTSNKVDLLSGVTAYDCIDGDVSSRIIVADSQIDLSQPGVYPVTYRVTTSMGVTSEIDMNVYVYPSRLSESILLKSYLVYTDSNNKIDPESYIDSFPEEYLETKKGDKYKYTFDILDEVNYDAPGVYYITYRLSRILKNAGRNDEAEILAEAYLAVAVKGEK